MVNAARNIIDAPGTPESAWRAWPGLGQLPALDAAGWASAVVVAAHPDDEVLGAGGTIAALAAGGARLRLVTLTDGEASHPHLREQSIAPRRAAETLAALDALGARDTEVIRLGLPDSGLAAHEHDVTARLQELASGFDLLLAPWDRDAHPDHEAAGRAARAARGGEDLLWYPVWMWHWARPGDPRVPWHSAVRVRLPQRLLAHKRGAIGCFASQLRDRGPGRGPVLAAAVVAHFVRDTEVFFPVSHR
jgi:LmbE family N-acetylglucosaminyl deacetylase